MALDMFIRVLNYGRAEFDWARDSSTIKVVHAVDNEGPLAVNRGLALQRIVPLRPARSPMFTQWLAECNAKLDQDEELDVVEGAFEGFEGDWDDPKSIMKFIDDRRCTNNVPFTDFLGVQRCFDLSKGGPSKRGDCAQVRSLGLLWTITAATTTPELTLLRTEKRQSTTIFVTLIAASEGPSNAAKARENEARHRLLVKLIVKYRREGFPDHLRELGEALLSAAGTPDAFNARGVEIQGENGVVLGSDVNSNHHFTMIMTFAGNLRDGYAPSERILGQLSRFFWDCGWQDGAIRSLEGGRKKGFFFVSFVVDDGMHVWAYSASKTTNRAAFALSKDGNTARVENQKLFDSGRIKPLRDLFKEGMTAIDRGKPRLAEYFFSSFVFLLRFKQTETTLKRLAPTDVERLAALGEAHVEEGQPLSLRGLRARNALLRDRNALLLVENAALQTRIDKIWAEAASHMDDTFEL